MILVKDEVLFLNWQSYNVVEQISIKQLYTLFNRHFEKNYNFAGEMHEFWELMYIIDGSMTVSADEKVHTLSHGDLIIFKPYQLHKFNVDDKDGATVLIATFTMQGELCKKIDGRAYHLERFQRSILKNFSEYLDYEIEHNQAAKEGSYWFNVLPFFENNHTFLQTSSLFISRILLTLSDSANTIVKNKTYETELFKQALVIMNENIDQNLSVEEIANRLNISISSLKLLFDKYAGMSVHKYFLTLKIKTATIMLKAGLSVSEVADQLGFSSQGYFSCCYKRETGNNPSHI